MSDARHTCVGVGQGDQVRSSRASAVLITQATLATAYDRLVDAEPGSGRPISSVVWVTVS